MKNGLACQGLAGDKGNITRTVLHAWDWQATKSTQHEWSCMPGTGRREKAHNMNGLACLGLAGDKGHTT